LEILKNKEFTTVYCKFEDLSTTINELIKSTVAGYNSSDEALKATLLSFKEAGEEEAGEEEAGDYCEKINGYKKEWA